LSRPNLDAITGTGLNKSKGSNDAHHKADTGILIRKSLKRGKQGVVIGRGLSPGSSFQDINVDLFRGNILITCFYETRTRIYVKQKFIFI
jgi:hypothetical protein